MNFARLLSRPRLMVDQVILCSVKGPCYGGGADLKKTNLGVNGGGPFEASSRPCVMSLEGCRGKVGCLPMVKPGAVKTLGDPSRPRWGLSGVAGRRGSPHQRRGPVSFTGQGESCLRRVRTGNEGDVICGFEGTLYPFLRLGEGVLELQMGLDI
jgi:hypothetical protein